MPVVPPTHEEWPTLPHLVDVDRQRGFFFSPVKISWASITNGVCGWPTRIFISIMKTESVRCQPFPICWDLLSSKLCLSSNTAALYRSSSVPDLKQHHSQRTFEYEESARLPCNETQMNTAPTVTPGAIPREDSHCVRVYANCATLCVCWEQSQCLSSSGTSSGGSDSCLRPEAWRTLWTMAQGERAT